MPGDFPGGRGGGSGSGLMDSYTGIPIIFFMSRKGRTDRMTAGRATAGIILLIGLVIMVASYIMGALWPFGLVMGFLLIAIAMMFLFSWHSRVTAYECGKCGHVFEVDKVKDLTSPHGAGEGGGWKRLECPKCGKKSKAKAILK
jgi:hypothetical protein